MLIMNGKIYSYVRISFTSFFLMCSRGTFKSTVEYILDVQKSLELQIYKTYSNMALIEMLQSGIVVETLHFMQNLSKLRW